MCVCVCVCVCVCLCLFNFDRCYKNDNYCPGSHSCIMIGGRHCHRYVVAIVCSDDLQVVIQK
jgi:hypothetical protein